MALILLLIFWCPQNPALCEEYDTGGGSAIAIGSRVLILNWGHYSHTKGTVVGFWDHAYTPRTGDEPVTVRLFDVEPDREDEVLRRLREQDDLGEPYNPLCGTGPSPGAYRQGDYIVATTAVGLRLLRRVQ